MYRIMFKYKIFSRENTIVDLRQRYEERNCQHFERMGVERGQDEGKWRRIGESTSRGGGGEDKGRRENECCREASRPRAF